jgi:hypothetical protein
MSGRRREPERNAGAFLGPDMLIPAPMHPLSVGPGKPGPEDEWKVPMGPIEIEEDSDETDEPTGSSGDEPSPDPTGRA